MNNPTTCHSFAVSNLFWGNIILNILATETFDPFNPKGLVHAYAEIATVDCVISNCGGLLAYAEFHWITK